jgi:hypothetical protein
MGMTYEEAKCKAMKLMAPAIEAYGECVIMDKHSLETDFGWVLVAQTKAFVEGDDGKQLVGHGLIIVDRDYDIAFFTGSRLSMKEYLDIYEKHRGDINAFQKAVAII